MASTAAGAAPLSGAPVQPHAVRTLIENGDWGALFQLITDSIQHKWTVAELLHESEATIQTVLTSILSVLSEKPAAVE